MEPKFKKGQFVRLVSDPNYGGFISYVYKVGDTGFNYEVTSSHGSKIFDDYDLEIVEEVIEAHDPVNHPSHYTNSPGGIECIQVTRHRNFNIGNAIKYLWRQGLKDEVGKDKTAKQIEDLKKAIWYINDEINRIETFSKESAL